MFNTKYEEGAMVRSKADPSIYGFVLGAPINGWNAVKLSMSKDSFAGEAPIGCLFNCTPKYWELIPATDSKALFMAATCYIDWVRDGSQVSEL